MSHGTRDRLPQRRDGEVIAFEHDGFDYVATVNRYPDGRVGEVFLTAAKTGTALQISVHDAAVAVSLALQHGCDVATLRHAFLRNADGSAAGVLGRLFDLIEQG